MNDIIAVNAIVAHLDHSFQQNGQCLSPMVPDKKLVRDFEGYAAIILVCTHGRLTDTELHAVRSVHAFAPVIIVFGKVN